MNWNEFKNIFVDAEIVNEKIVIKSDLVKVLSFIKENYHFEMLKGITAIDNKEQGIELVYNLYKVESVSNVFDSAVADEKEIYDLFGVKFLGNEELKRLYMPENWQGHPLKKDYVDNDERLNWND